MAVGTAQIIYISAFVAEIVRSADPIGAGGTDRRRPEPRHAAHRHPAPRRAAAGDTHRHSALLNNSLTAIKQTSYVSVVGAWELTYAAREVVERTLASFQIFLGVMAIYFRHLLPPVPARALVRERRFVVAH